MAPAHVPLILGTQWEGAVVIKLRSHRALALDGTSTFRFDDFEVPRATGFIELIGSRTGNAATSMLVGFSDEENRPQSTFALGNGCAVGTMVLAGQYFASWLDIAKGAGAHFRMGGRGQWNALASDAAFLQFNSRAALPPASEFG